MEESTNILPPAKELGCLAPLIGNWTTEGPTYDSILGPGVMVVSQEGFAWLDGGYFMVSKYRTHFGNEPLQTGILYWGYDTGSQKFHIHFFSNNGPYTKEGNEYTGEIVGGKLIFTGPAKFQYMLDGSGNIALNPDGTHTVYWWLPDEKGEWKPWMKNIFRRQH